MQEITRLDFGGVNGYLLKTVDGFILVDTGITMEHSDLDRILEKADCRPRNLKLVLLTHGDIDHAGNCAYLREKYAAKIAMHPDDAGMVERGDMGWNRKSRSDRTSFLGRIIMLVSKVVVFFSKQARFDVFAPDIFLEEGQDLSGYGLDARVLHIPGHSKGSIGVLTSGGDLLCGDLLMNMVRPDLHFLIDDLADCKASLEKLKGFTIRTVYPGHGKPFALSEVSPRLSTVA